MTHSSAIEAGREVLSEAKIWVSPEYGRWDPSILGLVPVG